MMRSRLRLNSFSGCCVKEQHHFDAAPDPAHKYKFCSGPASHTTIQYTNPTFQKQTNVNIKGWCNFILWFFGTVSDGSGAPAPTAPVPTAPALTVLALTTPFSTAATSTTPFLTAPVAPAPTSPPTLWYGSGSVKIMRHMCGVAAPWPQHFGGARAGAVMQSGSGSDVS
jgi:hypothetical protein